MEGENKSNQLFWKPDELILVALFSDLRTAQQLIMANQGELAIYQFEMAWHKVKVNALNKNVKSSPILEKVDALFDEAKSLMQPSKSYNPRVRLAEEHQNKLEFMNKLMETDYMIWDMMCKINIKLSDMPTRPYGLKQIERRYDIKIPGSEEED